MTKFRYPDLPESIQTREYQTRVINRTLQAYDDGHKTVMVELPTGAGKTIIALRLAQILSETFGWTIGWTCMRRSLLDQAANVNRETFKLPIKFFSSFTKEPPDGIDLLIEDEAQHSASETSTRLFSKIDPKLHLSMTATPFRTDRMKLCFSKVIKDAGLRQLVDEGWLSPYHLYVAELNWTPRTVADLYLQHPERWGKSVVFFTTLEHCYECQMLLRDRGIISEVVHGGSNQEAQIKAFNLGQIPILINVFVLTEGFDAPDLKTVFVRPSTKGPTMQMGGRGFRTHPDKPHVNIIQTSNTKWPFSRVASPEKRFNYIDGEWQERKEKTDAMSMAQVRMLKTIANTKVELPKFIKKNNAPTFRFRNDSGETEGTSERTERMAESQNVSDGVTYESNNQPPRQ